MEIDFDDPDLCRLHTERAYTAGHQPGIVKGFRKALGWVKAVVDERDLYAMHGLDFKPMEHRPGKHSMKINKQWRIIVELRGVAPNKRIGVIAIEDYH